MLDREFSLPWNLTMVVLGVPPGPGWFIEDKIDDPKVRSLLSKISVEEDEEATKLFFSSKGYIVRATVNIKTQGGKTFTEQADYAKGHEQDPFTDQELRAKFRTLAVPVLGSDKAERVIAIVDKLEELANISNLAEILGQRV
jgi:2-methylcitrate dehydratase PrpD